MLKLSWATKSTGTGKYSDKKKKLDGNAFTQVLDRFSSKLDKTLKKVQKATRRVNLAEKLLKSHL
jgi:flagellar hook-basal body complex protein FliE